MNREVSDESGNHLGRGDFDEKINKVIGIIVGLLLLLGAYLLG